MSLNSVVISGRAGKDPEIKQTAGGKSVGNFSIAVDDGYGQNKKTVWVNIEVWDKTAEAVGRLVTAGKRVAVVGSLAVDEWQDNSGNKKSRWKVRAMKVEIIDFPDKVDDNNSAPISDDDIPF